MSLDQRLKSFNHFNVEFLNCGGAIELVLETQKLLQLLFITITTSVPNFIIFLCTVHRAAIDFHLCNKNKKTNRYNRGYPLRGLVPHKTNRYNSASALSGLGPLK